MGILDDAFSTYNGGNSNGILAFYNRLQDLLQPGMQVDSGVPQGWTPPDAMGAAYPRIPYTGAPDASATVPGTAPGNQPVAMPQAVPSGSPDLGALAGGIGDRLGAGALGFLNSRGPLSALGNLVQGLATGRRTDPQGQALQQQQDTFQYLVKAGVPPAQAVLIAQSPEAQKAYITQMVQNKYSPIMGENAFGVKGLQGSFNANTGEFKPLNAQTSVSGGAGGPEFLAKGVTEVNSDLAGPAYLAQFSPEMQAAVKDRIEGKSLATGNPRKGFTQAVKMVAEKYGRDIGVPADDTAVTQRMRLRNQLASGQTGSLGGQLNAGNTAIGHLSDLSELASKLPNVEAPAAISWIPGTATAAHGINTVRNTAQSAAPAVNAFNTLRNRYVEEITKFYAGSPGAQAERERAIAALDSAKTPSELASAIKTEAEALHYKVSALDTQIHGGPYGLPAEEFPVIKPESEKALMRLNANVSKLQGNAPVPQTQAPSAALPEGATATNPKTGQKITFRGGQWVPVQ